VEFSKFIDIIETDFALSGYCDKGVRMGETLDISETIDFGVDKCDGGLFFLLDFFYEGQFTLDV
jgi:hypothetical protein